MSKSSGPGSEANLSSIEIHTSQLPKNCSFVHLQEELLLPLLYSFLLFPLVSLA